MRWYHYLLIILALIIGLYSGCKLSKTNTQIIQGKSDTITIYKPVTVHDTISSISGELKPIIIRDTIPKYVFLSDTAKQGIIQDYFTARIYPVAFADSQFTVAGSDTVRHNKLSQSGLILTYHGKNQIEYITKNNYIVSRRLYLGFTAGANLDKTLTNLVTKIIYTDKKGRIFGVGYNFISHSPEIELGINVWGD